MSTQWWDVELREGDGADYDEVRRYAVQAATRGEAERIAVQRYTNSALTIVATHLYANPQDGDVVYDEIIGRVAQP